jgi:hypothetical protein
MSTQDDIRHECELAATEAALRIAEIEAAFGAVLA